MSKKKTKIKVGLQPEVLRIYIGYDPRQVISFVTLASSITRHSSKPVSIMPLVIDSLPVPNEMQGLTPFTFTRWLVPWLADFKGPALFLDSDIIVRGDIAELFNCVGICPSAPVHVVKHTAKFEWPSMMMFECGWDTCAQLTPEYVAEHHKELNSFEWAGGRDAVGDLPPEWNHLVLYDPPNPDAKAVHFTAGIPMFPETEGCEFTEEFKKEAQIAMSSQPWATLMGQSVHVNKVKEHLTASGRLNPDGTIKQAG